MNAYIVDAIRTPIGKFNGSLSSVRPDDLAALVVKKIVERNSSWLDPKLIEAGRITAMWRVWRFFWQVYQ